MPVFLCVLTASLLVVGAPGAALAKAPGVFTVSHVAVDVTAKTAAAARETALLRGQRQAFERLLRRLTLRRDQGALPRLDDTQILEYVRDIEVDKERTSSVRYLADLTIRFKPAAIRRLLRDAGIPYAETRSKPVLVLPVYRALGTLILWDDPNPWRAAWAARPRDDSLVPLIVPKGDLADIAAISARQAVDAQADRLQAVADHYGATDTLVAVATLNMDSLRGRPTIDVAVSRFGSVIQERTMILSFAGKPGETLDDLLSRAVTEVTAQVEENWKRDNLLRFGSEETLSVTVPLDGLKEWLTIRNRLRSVAFVRDARLRSLSRSEAVVDLRFFGGVDQLRLALAQSDLEITEGTTSTELRLKGRRGLNAAR